MKPILSVMGFVAALVMCAVSSVMNYVFMASLGKTPLEGQALGAASAAADVLKALLPFFIAWSWAAGRVLASVSGTFAFLFFAAFSLLSAIGFAADNRDTLVEGREGISLEYNRVQRSVENAEARRSALPAHRPAAVVTEEIVAHRQNRRWNATKECANATESESRAFCAEYFKLRAELAAGTEAERLSALIGSLQSDVLKLRENGAGHDSDPQVSLLSRITGREPDSVRLALVIVVALLVEIGASLGLFLASGHGVRQSEASSQEAQVKTGARGAGSVENFCLEALIANLRGSMTMAQLLAGYQAWCARQGLASLDDIAFAAAFAEIADAIGLARDDGAYKGISLASAAPLQIAA